VIRSVVSVRGHRSIPSCTCSADLSPPHRLVAAQRCHLRVLGRQWERRPGGGRPLAEASERAARSARSARVAIPPCCHHRQSPCAAWLRIRSRRRCNPTFFGVPLPLRQEVFGKAAAVSHYQLQGRSIAAYERPPDAEQASRPPSPGWGERYRGVVETYHCREGSC